MSTDPKAAAWRLVVPVKDQSVAKSRLHPPPGVRRDALAHAFALDTLAAAFASVAPAAVLVVTSDTRTANFAVARGARVVPDPGTGLNGAIRAGLGRLRQDPVEAARGDGSGRGPHTAVLLGDLPTLTPGALATALRACCEHPRAFVPDAAGTGTVLLSSRCGQDLVPRFGADSAAAHAVDAVRMDLDLPELRGDVDDDESLRTAMTLGVGRHTMAVLGPAHGYPEPMQATVHRFDDDSGEGSVLLDDGRELPFAEPVFADSGLRHVRTGQRLSIETADGRVMRMWIVGIGEGQPIR